MTAEWWGVIATGATAVLALLAGAWSLILQAWGRRVVRFWVHDGRTSWTLEHHRNSPTVEFKLSNIGDAPALKVEVDSPGLHLSTPVGRGSATFESLAIMPSGTSVDLTLTVPIED